LLVQALDDLQRACAIGGSPAARGASAAAALLDQRSLLSAVTQVRAGLLDAELASQDIRLTRYSFTLRLLCTNQPSFHSPRPPALSTLVQYYCTIIGQYSTPFQPPICMLYTTQISDDNIVSTARDAEHHAFGRVGKMGCLGRYVAP